MNYFLIEMKNFILDFKPFFLTALFYTYVLMLLIQKWIFNQSFFHLSLMFMFKEKVMQQLPIINILNDT